MDPNFDIQDIQERLTEWPIIRDLTGNLPGVAWWVLRQWLSHTSRKEVSERLENLDRIVFREVGSHPHFRIEEGRIIHISTGETIKLHRRIQTDFFENVLETDSDDLQAMWVNLLLAAGEEVEDEERENYKVFTNILSKMAPIDVFVLSVFYDEIDEASPFLTGSKLLDACYKIGNCPKEQYATSIQNLVLLGMFAHRLQGKTGTHINFPSSESDIQSSMVLSWFSLSGVGERLLEICYPKRNKKLDGSRVTIESLSDRKAPNK
jgi:hypothetical protein